MNKTGATNRFNCPEDLVVSFATAAVICSIVAKERTSIIIPSNSTKTRIVDFGIKDDSYFRIKSHKAFFKDFKIKDFQFKVLK